MFVLDDDGDVVGVIAFEDDDGDVFVNVVAVQREHQGAGLGAAMLLSVLGDLSEASTHRVASWLVHPANFGAHAMSVAVGAEAVYPPEDKPFARYVLQL